MPSQQRRFALFIGHPENERFICEVIPSRPHMLYCGETNSLLNTYSVKTLTRNTELIITLNKLGQGISYTQLQENDTALTRQMVQENNAHA